MTTDTPYWLTKAQRNPHGFASVVYRPWGTPIDEDYNTGVNLLMRFAQWWYKERTGRTFRRIPAVNVQGVAQPGTLAPLNMYEISKVILGELEQRGIKDGSGKPISKCGEGPDMRCYLLFVPGPYNAGNMIGFDGTCPERMPSRGGDGCPSNPQWPRPGITGLSQKGLEIVAGHTVPYHTKGQTVGYDPVEKTYFYEWHAANWLQWAGAIVHEIGHILNLPHPTHGDPNASKTVMHPWWLFQTFAELGLLPSELEILKGNLLLR